MKSTTKPREHAPLCALTLATCAALLAACLSPSPGATGDDTHAPSRGDRTDTRAPAEREPDAAPHVPTAGCTPAGVACNTTATCCGELFCTGDGAYFVGTCEARLADGEPCAGDAWCASGTCWFGACGQPTCADAGAHCLDASDCCDANCLWDPSSPYVPGQCGPKRPNGAACAGPAWCASGACVDGTCADPPCADLGAECWWAGDCCGGLCLKDLNSPYVPGECSAPLPNGSACVDSTWCASGACRDGLCSGLPCTDQGTPCFTGSECCTSVCSTESVGHYGEGTCQDKLPTGAYCWYSSWCQSGDCHEFTCAP